MANFFLSSYTLNIKHRSSKKQSGKQYMILSNITTASGVDTFDIIRSFLEQSKLNYLHNTYSKTAIGVTEVNCSGRNLSGVIEFGKYGTGSRIFDTRSSTFSYYKSNVEAEFLPFYYLITIPRGAKQGLIFIQRTSQFGVADEFRDLLIKEIKNKLGNSMSVEIKPVIPASVAKDILKRGRVKKVRYTRFKIPTDLAEAIKNHVVLDDFEAELVISARRNRGLGIKQDLVKHLSDDKDFLVSFYEDNTNNQVGDSELTDVKASDVRLEVEIDGSDRVINLAELGHINPYYNITNRVQVAPDGHPVFESIDGIAKDMMKSFLEMLGVDDE